MRLWSLIISLLLLAACHPGLPAALDQGPPSDAPPEMQAGWHDGCESGISVYGSDIYKNMYAFRLDSKMVNNKTYYNSWGDAFNYCRHWTNSYLRNGLLGSQYSDDLRDPRVAKEGQGIMPSFLMW